MVAGSFGSEPPWELPEFKISNPLGSSGISAAKGWIKVSEIEQHFIIIHSLQP